MLRGIFRASGSFRTRSSQRDQATDEVLIGRIADAIDSALNGLRGEQAGLNRRIEEAAALASVAVGTDTDEYLSRDQARNDGLRQYETEMKAGRDRLSKLELNISHLKFLRAAFLTRFPGFVSSEGTKD